MFDLDIEDGVLDYEEHAVNRYSGPGVLLRIDYTPQTCCAWCEEQWDTRQIAEWLEYLRAQAVYPPPMLAQPLLAAA
jgi:hypothetical protein